MVTICTSSGRTHVRSPFAPAWSTADMLEQRETLRRVLPLHIQKAQCVVQRMPPLGDLLSGAFSFALGMLVRKLLRFPTLLELIGLTLTEFDSNNT